MRNNKRLVWSLIRSAALYRLDSWTLKKSNEKTIAACEYRANQLLQISWSERKNTCIWNKTGEPEEKTSKNRLSITKNSPSTDAGTEEVTLRFRPQLSVRQKRNALMRWTAWRAWIDDVLCWMWPDQMKWKDDMFAGSGMCTGRLVYDVQVAK